MRLGDVGEKGLLKYVIPRLKRVGEQLWGGDDGVDFLGKERLVLTGDMLVECTDVPRGMGFRDVGWKAVTSSISDLAAKGATPLLCFVELGLRPDMEFDEFVELWSGLEEACDAYSVALVGGDTNESRELVVGVFAVGSAARPVPRRGAREGQLVGVTGTFGRAAAGLHAVVHGVADQRWRPLVDSFFRPAARVKEGIALSRYVKCMIDSSDGLAATLGDLMDLNGVGFLIDSPPADQLALEYASKFGLNPFSVVFEGGEEYELVFTFEAADEELVRAALSEVGCELRVIGRVTSDVRLRTIWEGKEVDVRVKGWEHFVRHGEL
ncbi:MAG: thiamine-phosphate kinase [Thaumarchaeota archaeon]|nr:thiamine-phosphate kinase [Candidatus Calditenuaceae archaeon]MDW8186596.1 thiamine-phosphate kinase [Nitrososphaerota archaeon]